MCRRFCILHAHTRKLSSLLSTYMFWVCSREHSTIVFLKQTSSGQFTHLRTHPEILYVSARCAPGHPVIPVFSHWQPGRHRLLLLLCHIIKLSTDPQKSSGCGQTNCPLDWLESHCFQKSYGLVRCPSHRSNNPRPYYCFSEPSAFLGILC